MIDGRDYSNQNKSKGGATDLVNRGNEAAFITPADNNFDSSRTHIISSKSQDYLVVKTQSAEDPAALSQNTNAISFDNAQENSEPMDQNLGYRNQGAHREI